MRAVRPHHHHAATLPAGGAYTLASLTPADGHWLHGVTGTPEVPSGDFAAWLLGAGNHGIPITGSYADNRASTTQAWDLQPGFALATWAGHVDIAPGGLYAYGLNSGELTESWKAVSTGSGPVWQQWHDRTVASITNMATLWGSRPATLFIRPFHELNGSWYAWSVPSSATEVETVTIGGAPTGGTFTLTLGGQTTSALAYNVSAAAMQTALQALSTVGTGNMTVTLAGAVYTLTWAGTLANTLVPARITATSSLTGGATPTVTVTVTTAGVEPQEGYVKTVWQMWSTLCRSIFPAAKILFNCNATTSGQVDWRACFPGASYVDYLSVDYYNAWQWLQTQADWDAHASDTHWYKDPAQTGFPPRGLEAYRAWAAAAGLPMVISEWGNPAFNGTDGAGHPYSPAQGGDAPGFYDALHGWLTTHGGAGAGKVLYDVLFNVPNYASGSLEYTLWMDKVPGTTSPLASGAATTRQPLGQARYLAQWSAL